MMEQSSIQPAVAQLSIPVIGAVYRHYKGNCYRVIALSRHSETHEVYVVYQALYDSPQFCVPGADMGNCAVWARPLALFCEGVVVNGVEMPRFSRVD